MSSFYSGFKSLGESLLKPTISFFGGSKPEPKPEPRHSISGSFHKKSTSRMSFRLPEEAENDLNNSLEYPDSNDYLSLPKHKNRQEGLSTSTAASQHSPVKFSHSHTKSLVGWEGTDASILQEGEFSDMQSTDAPLLFSKGGYDAYVVTKGLNSDDRKMSMGPTKRKGGFLILEKNQSPEVKKPSFSRQFSTPQARLSGSFNFFSKQSEATASNTLASQVEEAIEEEVVDPLCGSKAPLVRKQTRSIAGSISHKRIPSNLSLGLSEINGDSDNNYMRAMTMKGDKRNFSTIWEDYENYGDQDIQQLVITEKFPQVPQTTKHQQTNSFFDFSPEDSKREDSVIIMPDQTSELELDFGDEEINNNSDSSCVQAENPVTIAKERLIQEYKAIQKQQLTSNGIYVVPTSDPFVWSCLIFIKGGYYENAKFKFQMNIPDTYPSGNIKVYALTKLYHPLINIETGELDLKLCEQKDENKITQVLTFMKSIFNESKYLEKQTSFNQEAGLKFSQNPYYFKVKAKDSVKTSQKNFLNENTERLPEILNRENIIKEALTTAAKQSINFDDKVQSLIASVKQKLKAD